MEYLLLLVAELVFVGIACLSCYKTGYHRGVSAGKKMYAYERTTRIKQAIDEYFRRELEKAREPGQCSH